MEPKATDTFQLQVPPNRLFDNYRTGDLHSIVGRLKVYSGSTVALDSGLAVNVRNANATDIPIRSIDSAAQSGPHVVNIRYDTIMPAGGPAPEALKLFYARFPDSFDFVGVVWQVDVPANRHHGPVKNEVGGIGLHKFNETAQYGSAGRLQGVSYFPLGPYFDLGDKSALHEIGHQWIKYLKYPPAAVGGGAHWPIADVAYGVMGWANAQQGLDFPWKLEPLGNGDYKVNNVGPSFTYNDLELYLMGLAPASEVADHFSFDNQNQDPSTGTLRGPVTAIRIGDLVAHEGPRDPAYGEAPTAFRYATVVLSKDRLLNEDEMAFFDHAAARGEARTELWPDIGYAKYRSKPFYLATGGRATLETTLEPKAAAPSPSSPSSSPSPSPSSSTPSSPPTSATPSSPPSPTTAASGPTTPSPAGSATPETGFPLESPETSDTPGPPGVPSPAAVVACLAVALGAILASAHRRRT